MNAVCSPIATDLELLTETAQTKAADRDRQQSRLTALIAAFEKQKLALSPSAYALATSEIEQQTLIVADAERLWSLAEAERAVAWAEEDRKFGERDRQQRLAIIDAALKAKTAELDELALQFRELPDKIARVHGEHMRLQSERAAL